MNKLKLTGLFAIVLASAFFISSCKKNQEGKLFYVVAAPLTAAQVIPASGATSEGTIDATYDNKTKLLSYTVSWKNLIDTATFIRVHGLADAGAIAVSPYVNGIIQTFRSSIATGGATTPAVPVQNTATFKATLFIDGIVLKEEDLLAGKYYIVLSTKAKPAGELRGQLIFNK